VKPAGSADAANRQKFWKRKPGRKGKSPEKGGTLAPEMRAKRGKGKKFLGGEKSRATDDQAKIPEKLRKEKWSWGEEIHDSFQKELSRQDRKRTSDPIHPPVKKLQIPKKGGPHQSRGGKGLHDDQCPKTGNPLVKTCRKTMPLSEAGIKRGHSNRAKAASRYDKHFWRKKDP